MAKRVIFLIAMILSAKAAAVEPTITPPPELKNRQASSTSGGLIGYLNIGGYWTPLSCDASATFSEWEDWGQCCYVGAAGCDFVTSCNGNTMYGQVDSTTCQYGCKTISVYSYLNAPSPVTGYGCLNWEGTLYENTFSTTSGYTPPSTSTSSSLSTTSSAASSTSQSSQSSSSSHTTSFTSTTLQNTTTSTTSTSALGSPQPDTTPSATKSKAWISGAVIGPVLGALILGLAFWVYRLRRGRSQEQQTQVALGATNYNRGGGHGPVPASAAYQVHTDDPLYIKPELFAGEPPSELPTSHGYYGGT